eukprot:CAMPEP_0172923584 /NCGR_PEP_ID=MMETSP1075-20121228/210008_1 /TAXON_ID=2916 /ORGANISM="Ceratium fusus, Strain PA161109" /LENGTH=53 /DNA_ID=CAMNT_0013784091 /DNA_START=85 /DNA_END=243 /DNA_ORIENTATION=+
MQQSVATGSSLQLPWLPLPHAVAKQLLGRLSTARERSPTALQQPVGDEAVSSD